LHYYQFAELPSKFAHVPWLRGIGGAQLMSAAFPNVRYVWLTRRDKARQAISFQLAASTGTWWIIEGVTRRPSESTPEPKFDTHAIHRAERALTAPDSRWQAYFKDSAIEPLVVYYEDLVADYRGQITRVLKWLGVGGADGVAIPPTRLKRQATTRN